MPRYKLIQQCLLCIFVLIFTVLQIRESGNYQLDVDQSAKFNLSQYSVPIPKKLEIHTNSANLPIVTNTYSKTMELFKTIVPVQKSNLSVSKHPLFKGFVITNPNLCKNKKVDILINIHSKTEAENWRYEIRKTWASATNFQHINIILLFTLGKPKWYYDQLKVESEYATYGDILQGNFDDTFKNLGHKAITFLVWANSHCSHARYILKADAEMFVDVFSLIQNQLQKISDKPFAFLCDLKKTLPIVKVNSSKWFVDAKFLKNRKTWPIFCAGYMNIFTGSLVPKLYESSYAIHEYVSVDDGYIGLLAEKLKIHYENIYGKISPSINQNALFQIKNNAMFDYFAFEVSYPSMLQTLWTARTNILNSWDKENSAFYQIYLKHTDQEKKKQYFTIKNNR